MKMKKIVAVNYVSAENRAEFLRYLKLLIEESTKEPGCIHYAAYVDDTDPTVITMLEEWKDDAAIETHSNSAHFQKYFPQIKALCMKEGDVRIYSLLDV